MRAFSETNLSKLCSRNPTGGSRLKFETLERRCLLTGLAPTVTDVILSSTEWTPAFLEYLDPAAMLGYHVPAGNSGQTKSLPWKNLDQVVIRFSEDVHVQASDLSLTGVGTATLAVEHFYYDAVERLATWTFSSPLQKNAYHIDLNGSGPNSVKDLDGNVLDGEWTDNSSVFASGNGVPGGDFQFTFKVLPGDSSRNDWVDYYDYTGISSRVGAAATSSNYSPLFDIDGSGSIGPQDAQDIWNHLWTTYPSGTPLGASNDAPTTLGGSAISITNTAVDVAISLFGAFADAETSDNQLTYQILSNSNPSLFDSVSLNSLAGQLVLNAAAGASGRSRITVRAADAGGLSTTATFVVDVNYANVKPTLNYWIQALDDDTFEVFGVVSDDDIVEGLFVQFDGALDMRATVRANGTFGFVVDVLPEDWGPVSARVRDFQGACSLEVSAEVNIS